MESPEDGLEDTYLSGLTTVLVQNVKDLIIHHATFDDQGSQRSDKASSHVDCAGAAGSLKSHIDSKQLRDQVDNTPF